VSACQEVPTSSTDLLDETLPQERDALERRIERFVLSRGRSEGTRSANSNHEFAQ
jgi:hypothetical protein